MAAAQGIEQHVPLPASNQAERQTSLHLLLLSALSSPHRGSQVFKVGKFSLFFLRGPPRVIVHWSLRNPASLGGWAAPVSDPWLACGLEDRVASRTIHCALRLRRWARRVFSSAAGGVMLESPLDRALLHWAI